MIRVIKSRRRGWAGLISRIAGGGLVRKPEVKRTRGTPMFRWENYIKMVSNNSNGSM
jgi:hypothetical protein